MATKKKKRTKYTDAYDNYGKGVHALVFDAQALSIIRINKRITGLSTIKIVNHALKKWDAEELLNRGLSFEECIERVSVWLEPIYNLNLTKEEAVEGVAIRYYDTYPEKKYTHKK